MVDGAFPVCFLINTVKASKVACRVAGSEESESISVNMELMTLSSFCQPIRMLVTEPPPPGSVHEKGQWGKTRTKIPDGAATEVGPFPRSMAY